MTQFKCYVVAVSLIRQQLYVYPVSVLSVCLSVSFPQPYHYLKYPCIYGPVVDIYFIADVWTV